VAEDLAWGEYHVLGNLGVLHHFAIDSGKKPSTGRSCVVLFCADKQWSNRRKFVERLRIEGLTSRIALKLEESTGQVVTNCVAKDIRVGVLGLDIFGILRCDEHQLALVVRKTRRAKLIEKNVLSRICQGSGRFGPKRWVFERAELRRE
jgi:hypothetical protein